MSDATTTPRQILLVEPQFVLRRTIVAVARDLGVGELHEATSSAAALPLLARRSFDGIVLNTGDQDTPFDLLTRLRAGQFASPADIPVVALVATAGDAALDARLAAFRVDAQLRKPFKVGELLQLIGRMNRPRQPSRPDARHG